jgi:hypothetical protein
MSSYAILEGICGASSLVKIQSIKGGSYCLQGIQHVHYVAFGNADRSGERVCANISHMTRRKQRGEVGEES